MTARCLALLLAALACPALARAQRADTTLARVTYVSGASVYIDAGESAGLAVGDTVQLLRAGRALGGARVVYLASRRAQCEVLDAVQATVGDTVRIVSVRVADATRDTSAVVAPVSPMPSPRRPRAQALRGRVGLRYFTLQQRDSGSGGWTQPSSDVLLDGPLPNAPNLSVALDARGRRTTFVTISGVAAQPRTSTTVYQASLGWQGGSTRVRVGRQFSEAMADVSLFDGALVEYDGTRFGAGAFAGSQPDPATMGFSSRVREYGAYAAAHQRDAGSAARWTTTAGAIGSYDAGQLDREFVFASGSWTSALLTAYVLQEVDYNRGWKRGFSSAAFTPTSTLAALSARVVEHVSVEGGYDSRRNVRLYRDYLTPEIAFDDAFRTGVWGGVRATASRGSAAVDYRRSYGGSSGSADIVSGTLAASAAPLLPVRASERSSHYLTPATTGWLHSLSLSGDVTPMLELEATGGVRREHDRPSTAVAGGTAMTAQWYELGATWTVARSWYLMLTLTRELGGWEASDQAFAGITYRF